MVQGARERHLVTVEVGVEGRANQGVEAGWPTIDKLGSKALECRETVQGGSPG